MNYGGIWLSIISYSEDWPVCVYLCLLLKGSCFLRCAALCNMCKSSVIFYYSQQSCVRGASGNEEKP